MIKRFLLRLLGVLGEFIEALLKAGTKDVLDHLLPFALRVVTQLGDTDLSNEKKRQKAFEDIKQYGLDTLGDIGDSLVNTAIELAVQKWKESR